MDLETNDLDNCSKNNNYSDCLNFFYENKAKYEKKYTNKKNKILKNDKINKKEKRERIKKIKKKCMRCNGEGGTIFTNKKNKLTIKCNHSPPCKLNIIIKKPQNIYIPKKMEELTKTRMEMKENITKLKFDYLFDLIDERVMNDSFDVQREHLRKISNEIDEIEKHFLEIDMIEYDEETTEQDTNEKSSKEKDLIQKDKYIKQQKTKLLSSINKFKNDLDKFYSIPKSNINFDDQLKDVIEYYKDVIIPLIAIIQKTENREIFIKKPLRDNDEIFLIKNEYLFTDSEINDPFNIKDVVLTY